MLEFCVLRWRKKSSAVHTSKGLFFPRSTLSAENANSKAAAYWIYALNILSTKLCELKSDAWWGFIYLFQSEQKNLLLETNSLIFFLILFIKFELHEQLTQD